MLGVISASSNLRGGVVRRTDCEEDAEWCLEEGPYPLQNELGLVLALLLFEHLDEVDIKL